APAGRARGAGRPRARHAVAHVGRAALDAQAGAQHRRARGGVGAADGQLAAAGGCARARGGGGPGGGGRTGGGGGALALPTGSLLRPGDVLAREAGWYLVVEGRPEPVLAVFPRGRAGAIRIALEGGDRR